MKCRRHPRYQVKRKPRSRCLVCWFKWWFRDRDELALQAEARKQDRKLRKRATAEKAMPLVSVIDEDKFLRSHD